MSFNEQPVEQNFLVTPLQECLPNFMTPRGRVRRLQPLRIPLIDSNSNLHQCSLHRAPWSLCPPNLPWSEFPQLLHPGYCDTKILFLLYPQTPVPRSLSLRNSTLGHFAPKFCSPVLKATGPASQILTPPPQGVSLFSFPPPQSSPTSSAGSSQGAAPRQRPPPPRPISDCLTRPHHPHRRGQSAAAMQLHLHTWGTYPQLGPSPYLGEPSPLPPSSGVHAP